MDEEDQCLVQLVQEFPFLYDKELKEFKDRGMKLKAWESIGETMNISHQAAVSRWKAIRERFAREKKQQSILPDGTLPSPSSWQLYDAMKFLEKHVKPRKRGRSKAANHKPGTPKAIATNAELKEEESPKWHNMMSQMMESNMVEHPSSFLFVRSPNPVRTPSPDSQSTSGQSESPMKKKRRKSLEQSLNEADIVKITGQQLLQTNERTEDNLFAQSIAKSIVDLLGRCNRKQRHRKKIAILQMINDLDSDDDV